MNVGDRVTFSNKSYATYTAVRQGLGRTRGPASQHACACGQPAHEWAYDRSDPSESFSASGLAFSSDLSRYLPTCRSCNRGAANVRAQERRAAGYLDKATERFAKYVVEGGATECWPWLGTVKKNGYGQLWFNGKPDRAHRVSYQINKGPIPDGMLIRHTCDNKVCVNPNHLLTGTPLDNARDAIERNLYPRGETQGRAKLTLVQVEEIRRNWRNRTESQRSMSDRFGVSTSCIQFVATGNSWIGLGESA